MTAKNQTPVQTGFTFNTAKAAAEAEKKIGLHEHNAVIKAQSVKLSSNGDPLVNLRWEIAEGDDQGKTVFDMILFKPARFQIERIEQFCSAIGRDAGQEFGDTPLDLDFVTGWAESLIGEQATIKLAMGKASKGADGTEYEPKIEIKKYLPYGNAQNGNDLIDLD